MSRQPDPLIRQLQQDLDFLGYKPGPIDGLSGAKTQAAIWAFSVDHGLDPEHAEFIGRVHGVAEAKRAEKTSSVVALPPGYLDLSERCTNKDWRKKERAWADIKGVTLHQTGCPMNETPERWLSLKAHYGVTYSGKIFRIHPETSMGWHAQGQSHHNIGVEIAGCFRGIDDDPKTFPGQKGWAVQSVTPEQVTATKELLRYLARLLSSHGSELTLIQPHRMATDSRQPDPGEKVWQEIAIPMLTELGCGVGQVTGDGMEIPFEWGGKAGVKY